LSAAATKQTTEKTPKPAEWIPVILEALILIALLVRMMVPAFLKGQLLPCLAIGLAPGTLMRFLGKSSWGAHRVGVAVGLILFMIYNGDINPSLLRDVFVNWQMLAAGVALMCLPGILGAARWQVLLHGQNMKLGYIPTLRLTMIGMFFNQFVPGATGGDLFRAYYVGRDQKRTSEALATVILDRFLGLPPLVLILAVAAWMNLPLIRTNAAFSNFSTIFGVVLGVSLALFALVFLGASRFANWIEPLEEKIPGGRHILRLSHAAGAYRKNPLALLEGIFYGFLAHLCQIFAAYLFGRAAGLNELPMTMFAILIPVGLACNSLPVSPGGAGVGEKAFGFLFEAVKTGSGPQGVVIMLCMRLGLLPCALVGAILYAMGKHAIDVAFEDAEHGEEALDRQIDEDLQHQHETDQQAEQTEALTTQAQPRECPCLSPTPSEK